MLMFGMSSARSPGCALLNPISIGAGLLLGGKTDRDERRRVVAAPAGRGEDGGAPLRRRGDVPGRQGLPRHAARRPARRCATTSPTLAERAEPLARGVAARRAERSATASRRTAAAARRDRHELATAGAAAAAGRGRCCRRRRRAPRPVNGPRRDDRRASAGRGPGRPSGMARAVLAAGGRRLPRRARGRRAGWPHSSTRLDGPLRIAIAGKVKAGKSTLLNALVGEQIAPTDAGECTRVVTWYRDGARSRGSRCSRATGAPVPLPVDRRDGALVHRPARRPRRATSTSWRSTGPRRACASPR